MQKVRYAAPDPTLPRPWRGLVDSATRNLYFWNPETNVTTYVRPTADPQPPHPDIDNRSDRSHQIHGVVDLGGCGDDVNNGDPSHQSQGVNRDTSSQLNDKQSVPVSEAHGEEHGHKHEPTVLAKRKDTSKSNTLKKTYSKKQKTTSPPLVVDATEGHVEELIMKPTEVSHSVEKGQQESNEVHKTDQLAKETRKAKRKDTSKSHTLRKTYSKKQKTTSPPLVVGATEGHVEESIMKPMEVSHLVEKGQQESDEFHKTDQLAKETRKAKRKDTSRSHTLEKTYSKKQKTTSPPLVVDDHVEDSIMKPTEVSHSVEKGQQDSDEVHKTNQLAKKTRKAKRKDTSKSHTLKKTYSKKQKTTSPPLVVDATEGHVEESIMKPTEASHSVEKGQQESDEVHKTDQLAKETRKAKRKDTSKSHILKKTYSKKQRTISPPLVVDATEGHVEKSFMKLTEGHVEKSFMKPTEVTHSVEKGQQESLEVHKTGQLAKETQKMSEVEGEVPQSASTNGAELLQANRSETFEMNAISSICTTLVAKEMDNSLHEELPIMGTDPNQELLSIADGPEGLGKEIIDRDGLMDQDGGPIIDNLSNYNVDCPTIDSTKIEANLEKQPIKRSLAPSIDKVEEDLALSESIDRLAGVTDQLFGAVEAMRYMIQYTVSARETEAQRRRENEGLKKNVLDLKRKVADLEAKLKETMMGNQHARCQFLGSKIAGS